MNNKNNYKLKCIECGKEYSKDEVRYVCPDCSKHQKPFYPLRGLLEIVINKDSIDYNNFNIPSFLPLSNEYLNNYKVGNTPLILSKRLCEKAGFKNLYIKNDGKNPTNSLKDRASYLVVADALNRKEKEIAAASTGNAASSLAGVCAFAGIDAVIFVPSSAPKGKLAQMYKYGAKIILVDGSYDDAFELSIEYSNKTGACNRNTGYNPMTTEGKKTVALEIFRDLNFNIPDVVFVPVGDGSIISGVCKGFFDLKKFGFTKNIPQIIGVQAEGSDSIYRGFESGIPPVLEKTDTIADSISVSAPRNGIRAIRDIKNTNGYVIKVSDNDILEAQSILASHSGIFAEPAASASFAGFIKEKNQFDRNKTIVILSTGDGLKDINSALKNISVQDPVKPDLKDVMKFLEAYK